MSEIDGLTDALPAAGAQAGPQFEGRRRVLVVGLGRVVLGLVMLATTRVMTELLTPDEVGRAFLLLTVSGLFAMAAVGPLGNYFNRQLHPWNEEGVLGRRLAAMAGWFAIVALVASVLLSGLVLVAPSVLGVPLVWVVGIVAGSLIVGSLHQTVVPSFNLLGYAGWFVGAAVVTAIGGLALSAFMVLQVGARAEVWLLGALLVQAVVVAAVLPSFLERVKRRPDARPLDGVEVRRAFRFAVPLAASVGFWWVQSQGYRFVLAGSDGAAALGLFAMGYMLASGILALFEAVLTQVLQPAYYRAATLGDEADRRRAWERYAGALFPALLLTGVLVVAAAPLFAKVLLAPSFQGAVQFAAWGAAAECARIAFAAYTLVNHVEMDTRSLILPHAVGALVAVGVTIAFVPSFGGHAAGAALVGANLLTLVLIRRAARSHLPVRVGLPRLAQGLVAAVPVAAIGVYAWWVQGTPQSLVAVLVVLGLVGLAYLGGQGFLLRSLLELGSRPAGDAR